MDALYYFAYGSNLHPLRMRRRVPSARVLGRARLRGYQIRFHKRGRDLSAKCDAYRTGRGWDFIHGVVYRMARRDRVALDRAEDLGRGYDRIRLWVSVNGRRRAAFAYLARPEAIIDDLRPFDWYLEYVVRGARHQGLPGRYLAGLGRTPSSRDRNAARRNLNRRVLLSGAPPYRRR